MRAASPAQRLLCVLRVLCASALQRAVTSAVRDDDDLAPAAPTRHDLWSMTHSPASPRVLVMGCGGIGGIIACGLTERGVDAVIVTHNPAIADAITRRGFVLRDARGYRVVPGRAQAAVPDAPGQFDFVFLTTQPPQVVAAARTAAPHLRPGGAMRSEERRVGKERRSGRWPE